VPFALYFLCLHITPPHSHNRRYLLGYDVIIQWRSIRVVTSRPCADIDFNFCDLKTCSRFVWCFSVVCSHVTNVAVKCVRNFAMCKKEENISTDWSFGVMCDINLSWLMWIYNGCIIPLILNVGFKHRLVYCRG